MPELIAVLLIVMWLLGLVSSYFGFHGISVGINVERKLAKGSGLGGIQSRTFPEVSVEFRAT